MKILKFTLVCLSLSHLSHPTSSSLFSQWWGRFRRFQTIPHQPLLKTNWDRLSSLGFITGTWYPVFPPYPSHSPPKKDSYTFMKDMFITVFENKTLQVNYKGSILQGRWELLHGRPSFPFSNIIQQSFHSILIDTIRCTTPPSPQYWMKLVGQFHWAERLNKTGLRIDFPILPYLLVSPVPSSLLTHPHGVATEMAYDMTEDVPEATLWGYWSCGDKKGKVYLVPVRE